MMEDSEILHASFKEWVLQDWQANAGRTDARFVVVAFRIAQFLCRRYPLLYDLYKVPYWLILSVVLGIELPAQITIGKRLQIWHAHAIIINIHAVIGDDCILRHGVTIGNQGQWRRGQSRRPAPRQRREPRFWMCGARGYRHRRQRHGRCTHRRDQVRAGRQSDRRQSGKNSELTPHHMASGQALSSPAIDCESSNSSPLDSSGAPRSASLPLRRPAMA